MKPPAGAIKREIVCGLDKPGILSARGKLVKQAIDRHALTIAGSRMGKGACQIIPTLRQWQGGAIVIDPKGESAIETIEDRLKLGQTVALLDPMDVIKRPEWDELKVAIDPFDFVRDGSDGVRDLFTLADGVVKQTGFERDPHWNESARALIAGCLARMKANREEHHGFGHLPDVLGILKHASKMNTQNAQDVGSQTKIAPPDKETAYLYSHKTSKAYGGLAQDVWSMCSRFTNEVGSIFSTAERNVRFLRDNGIAGALHPVLSGHKKLDLADLPKGHLTLYIILPADALTFHSRFLRLIIRMALGQMMRTSFDAGSSGNAPCLFVLDEFFSLGQIDEIQAAAGLMPGYGVHLWPILQDWGQMLDLYQHHGANTFLANADVVSVFGITDPLTLQEISKWFGETLPDDIHDAMMRNAILKQTGVYEEGRPERHVLNEQISAEMGLMSAAIGRARMSPTTIQKHIARPFDGNIVAERMFVFLRTGEVNDLKPDPYFT